MVHSKNIFLFFILILSQLTIYGQTGFSIRGKVINAETREPISFVNLGILHTTLGTATDYKGDFELKLKDFTFSDTLQVSAIGFSTIKRALNSFTNDTTPTFKLSPIVYTITQFDLSAPSRVVYGIIKDAVSNIQNNYSVSGISYLFDYYSLFTKESIRSIRNSSGILIDSSGYMRGNFLASANSLSYSFTKNETNFPVSRFKSGLCDIDDLLTFDIVRNRGNVLDTDRGDQYALSLLKVDKIDDDTVYVIGYKNINPDISSTGDAYIQNYEGEIYIKKSDFAVIKSVIRAKSEKLSMVGRSFFVDEKTLPAFGNSVNYTATAIYQLANKRYVLRKISLSRNFLTADGKSASTNSEITINLHNLVEIQKVPVRQYYTGSSTSKSQ